MAWLKHIPNDQKNKKVFNRIQIQGGKSTCVRTFIYIYNININDERTKKFTKR